MKNLAGVLQQFQLVTDLFGLFIAVIIVHLIYTFVIDPSAAEILYQAGLEGLPPPRTISVILKDIEQEICLILGLWCCWLWLFRYQLFMDEPHLLNEDFLNLESVVAFDDNTLNTLRTTLEEKKQSLPQIQLLGAVSTSLDALNVSGTNSQFKDASDLGTESCELYLEQLESKLSLTKYILWAIPSIGFLGTVRGIGEALGKAGEAMAGDISGVAASLGVAFNSTFCALFVSLLLMFISYLLQGREEKLVANYKRFIATDLVGKLSSLAKQPASLSLSHGNESTHS